MSCPIYIGIAGWSYADWRGVVYPSSSTDQLAYVHQYVDCIEINSTFYRPPSDRNAQIWLDKTQDKTGFFFTAKLHKSFTHENRIDPNLVNQIHQGFEPLLKANRLKHLLAQFNYDYNEQELHQIKDRLTQLAESSQHIVLIGNNHYKGAELANAIELKHLLTDQKQRVPPGLIKAYPRLKNIALKEKTKGQQSFDF